MVLNINNKGDIRAEADVYYEGIPASTKVQSELVSEGIPASTKVQSELVSEGIPASTKVQSELVSEGITASTKVQSELVSEGITASTKVQSKLVSEGIPALNLNESYIYGDIGATEYAWECLGQSNDNMYDTPFNSTAGGGNDNFSTYIENLTTFMQMHITNMSYILLSQSDKVLYNVPNDQISGRFTNLVQNNKGSSKLDEIISFVISIITDMLGRVKQIDLGHGTEYIYKPYLRESIDNIKKIIDKLRSINSTNYPDYFMFIDKFNFLQLTKTLIKQNRKVDINNNINGYYYDDFKTQVNDVLFLIGQNNKPVPEVGDLYDYITKYINTDDLDTDFYLANNIDNIMNSFKAPVNEWKWDRFEYLSYYISKLYYNPIFTDYNNKNQNMMETIMQTFYHEFLDEFNGDKTDNIGDFTTNIYGNNIENNIYAKGGNCYKYLLKNILNDNKNLQNDDKQLYDTLINETKTLSDWDYSIHSDIDTHNISIPLYLDYMLKYQYIKDYPEKHNQKTYDDLKKNLHKYIKTHIRNRNYINSKLIEVFKQVIIQNNKEMSQTVTGALHTENKILHDKNLDGHVSLIALKQSNLKTTTIFIKSNNKELFYTIYDTNNTLMNMFNSKESSIKSNLEELKDEEIHDHSIIINNAIYGINNLIYTNPVISKFDLSRIIVPYYICFNLTNGYKYYLKTFGEYIDVSIVDKFNDLNESPLSLLKNPLPKYITYTEMQMGKIKVSSLHIISFLYDVIRMLYCNESPNKHSKKLDRLTNIHKIIKYTPYENEYISLLVNKYYKMINDYKLYNYHKYCTYDIKKLLLFNYWNDNIAMQRSMSNYVTMVQDYLDNKCSNTGICSVMGGTTNNIIIFTFIILFILYLIYIVKSKHKYHYNRIPYAICQY